MSKRADQNRVGDDRDAEGDASRLSRRHADSTLPLLFRFLLSLVVLLGSFAYLFVAQPDQIVTAAILAAVGAVITYWFVSKVTNPPGGPS